MLGAHGRLSQKDRINVRFEDAQKFPECSEHLKQHPQRHKVGATKAPTEAAKNFTHTKSKQMLVQQEHGEGYHVSK